MSQTGIVFDERFLSHLTGKGHPESPERLAAIRAELTERDLWSRCVSIPTRAATREELGRFHTAAYLDEVRREGETAAPAAGALPTYEVAALAAGGMLEAVDALMAGAVDRALALVRPPGHHAGRDRGHGFCVFNNVVLAALHALEVHGLERILVVDWDIHHGDGTQQAFYDSDRVLFFSIHRENLFPATGATEEIGRGPGTGYTININLEHGFGNGMYEAIFAKILEPVLWRYRPQLILVSAGFDAYYLDDLGLMKVTSEGYVRLAARLLRLADKLGHGRVLFCLEGGYHVRGLARSVRYLIEACLDSRSELNLLLKEPQAFAPMLQRVQAAVGDHWSGLGRDHHLSGLEGYLWDGNPFVAEDLSLVTHADPHEGGHWVEARLGGAVVGRAKLGHRDGAVVVKFITTHDEVKYKGVARRIVRHLQEQHPSVIAQGVKYQARGFWGRLGFEPVAMSKDYRWYCSETRGASLEAEA